MQKLKINDLKVPVYIGNTDAEQREKSFVMVCIEISFMKNLGACESDDLSETICYDNLIANLREAVSEKRFRLIEKLAKFIYDKTKEIINRNDAKIVVTVTKTVVPIENLDSVSFAFGDYDVD